MLKAINASAPKWHELKQTPDGIDVFHAAISRARGDDPIMASVEIKERADYEDALLFLTNDGKAGFALIDDDIVSAFNAADSPYRAVSMTMLLLAVELGGRRLDAFDIYLPDLYAENGFRVTGWIACDEAE